MFSHHHHQIAWLTPSCSRLTSFFPFLFSLTLLLQLKVKRMIKSRFTTSTAHSPLWRTPTLSHQVNSPLRLDAETFKNLCFIVVLYIFKMFQFPPSFLLLILSPLPPSVYTSGGGNLNAGLDDGKRKFVSYDTALGRNPGMTTCTSCQQQVMTNVTYKAGMYAWLMCLLFICCGWVCGSGCLLGPYRWLIQDTSVLHPSSY